MDPTEPKTRASRFGLFEADFEQRVLTKGGLRIKLQDQPFQVLALLVDRPGEIVTRDEIRQKLWSADTYVEFDDGLNTTIKKLRLALGDAADNPRFIETVPRRGYRFLAPVDYVAHPVPERATSKQAVDTCESTKHVILTSRERVVVEQKHHRYRRFGLTIAAATLLIVAVLYTARVRSRSSATKLTEKDTIVLADVTNTTGDTVFDGTLKQALSVELGQSPFLNVASDLKVTDTLRRMDRSPTEPITRELAREVCVRMGSKAIIAGSIASLGSHYVLGLEALGCANGDTLARGQAEAVSKEGVLKALGGVVSQVRGKVGESLSSLEKYDFPADATTGSLEALRGYAMGIKTARETEEAKAIPFFQHAIQLDPGFALAYAELGAAYDNLGEETRAADNLTKAYGLLDHLTERERYHITAMYHSDVTGDLDKEQAACELWAQNYPRDMVARSLLAEVYTIVGQREKAKIQFEEALRLDPDSAISYGNLAVGYVALDRLSEGKAALDRAQARGLDGIIIHENLYSIAFLRGETAEMGRQVAWAAGKPGVEDKLLSQESDTEAYYGRLRRAREVSRRAAESTIRSDDQETAAIWRVNAALREAEIGNPDIARQDVKSALKLAASREVNILAALVFARIGDVARAKRMIGQLERENPSNTILKVYWLPTLRASLAVHADNPESAVSLLQIATPYELGEAAYISNMYPAYIRGQAYLLAHNGKAAATEFKKLLDHPGIVQNDILGALSLLQLARAEQMAGDKDAAGKEYSSFIMLWKDADPDIPALVQAKAEYARLQLQ
jgi:DNA-binding winged helix-turn-helix (wHTH) protein/Flp pilus assembly protein TadD